MKHGARPIEPAPLAPARLAPARLAPGSTYLVAGIACAVLGLYWALSVDLTRTWGWDESMHAELPAARMLLSAQAGDVRAAMDDVLNCQQYPFAYPVLLAAVQAVTGISEFACRATGRAILALLCFGLFLLGTEIVGRGKGRGRPLVPAVAAGFAALSPLALHYSGTLFVEVPFATALVFTLRAWLRRDGRLDRRRALLRELAAGTWITLCIFIKFNYAILFGFALFLDLVIEGVLEARAGRGRRALTRTAALAAMPAVAIVWWFVLPLPAGLEMGASHRATLAAYLSGNRDFVVGWGRRALDWSCAFAPTPRWLFLELTGLILSLRLLRQREVRTTWLVLLGVGVPVWTHPYHIERLLIPCAPALWMLAALGLGSVIPPRPRARVTFFGLVLLAWVPLPRAYDEARVPWDTWLVGRATDVVPANPGVRAYVLGVLEDMSDVSGDRPLSTGGLTRVEADAFLDRIAGALGPVDRLGWIGINPELSPAAIRLGLLDRGFPIGPFRSEAGRTRLDGNLVMCITHRGEDPGWTGEQVRIWASAFDVVLTTTPIDLKGRSVRGFLDRYVEDLLAGGEWNRQSLGTIDVTRPGGGAVPIELFAIRRN